jgi:hypothetical protein
MNNHSLYSRPGLMNADDTAKLASIRAEGGPSLAEIAPRAKRAGEPAVDGSPKASPKNWNTPDLKKMPYTPAKRIVANPVKPARKKGIGV